MRRGVGRFRCLVLSVLSREWLKVSRGSFLARLHCGRNDRNGSPVTRRPDDKTPDTVEGGVKYLDLPRMGPCSQRRLNRRKFRGRGVAKAEALE